MTKQGFQRCLANNLVIVTLLITSTVLFERATAVLLLSDTTAAASEDGGALLLLSALGTSECFRLCIQPLTVVLAGLLQFRNTFNRIDGICRSHELVEECMQVKKCEDAELFKGISQSMNYMCKQIYQQLQFSKPCLQRYDDEILIKTDTFCGFKKALYELVNSNNTRELAEDGGNQIVLLEELGSLCRGVSCFVAKVQRDLNLKCPVMGFLFAEIALIPIEALRKSIQMDILELASSYIPKGCQIFLHQEDIMLIKILGVDPTSNQYYGCNMEKAGGGKKEDTMLFLDLPVEVLSYILDFLSYEQLSMSRSVCKTFDTIAQSKLNIAFDRLNSELESAMLVLKHMLPKRESKRRYHPLARINEIYSALETRFALLNMTFKRYIEDGVCCFMAGKILDEAFFVLHYVDDCVKKGQQPEDTQDLLKDIRDYS
uniref:F-box domain-containing protein n=1 Tax=Syphacia muris TaxID=451379 RepID=A0A0N5AC09_9BILA